MKVSIVTPTYNSEEYLEKCIQSIMGQSHTDYEHIIVDGGSKDRTIEIIKKYENQYNMIWISEPDQGMYDAIAKGFRMATGDILCWLNSDDFYMPWTLKEVSTIFEKRNIHWVVGSCSSFNQKTGFSKTELVTFPRYAIKSGWMDGTRLSTIQQESSFWSKKLYDKVGGLNINLKMAGDFDLWHKFAQYETLFTVNSVFANFRVHEGQKSSDKEKYRMETGGLNLWQKLLHRIKFYKVANKILRIFYVNKLIIDIDYV